MKRIATITIATLATILWTMIPTNAAQAQMAYTYSGKNLMIQGADENAAITKEADAFHVALNKVTGEFSIDIPMNYLDDESSIESRDWNNGEMISITGVIPIEEVLRTQSDMMDLLVEADVRFKGNEYKTDFNFSIINMQRNEFLIQAEGIVDKAAIANADQVETDNELMMVMRFHGG